MKDFSISMPLMNEFFTTVRLATGGMCTLAGFDIDSMEDFKVCVTESLLILKRKGFKTAKITFTNGDMLSCEIVGCDKSDAVEDDTINDDISYALLNALIGNTNFTKDENGIVYKIDFQG